MELTPSMRAAFDAMREGITIIDVQGRIVFGNRAYLNFLKKDLGHDPGKIEGVRLRDLRPNARLPDVLETRVPAVHITRQEIKDFYFVNMYPIFEGEKLVGGISVVTFIEDAYGIRDQVEALEIRSRQVIRSLNKANGARYTFDQITAVGPAATAAKELAQRIASTDATVLLESESGTGKELYAQAIHNASGRSQGVFVAINCANFNANTLESELFGYADGAFTGAKRGGKVGLFEAAAGGTLFLDEVSEMDYSLQAKLLRALQEHRIRPLGAVKEVEVDVRVVAACNADLLRYVEEGKFRRDLYYRLSTFPVHIPPLRERREDIPALARDLLSQLSHKLRKDFTLSDGALKVLCLHNWPGNVRELRNVLEFAAYLSQNGHITAQDLPANLGKRAEDTVEPLAQQVRRFEREAIRRRLRVNGESLAGKKQTAKELGISLASLYNKLQENVPEL